MRALTLCLTVSLLVPIAPESVEARRQPLDCHSRDYTGGGAIRHAGVYLKAGLVITAAHLTALDTNMSARIAGMVLPAKVLKQGSLEDVDLSLFVGRSGEITKEHEVTPNAAM